MPEPEKERIDRLEALCRFHGIDTSPPTQAEVSVSGAHIPLGLSARLDMAEQSIARLRNLLTELANLHPRRRRISDDLRYELQNYAYAEALKKAAIKRFELVSLSEEFDEYGY